MPSATVLRATRDGRIPLDPGFAGQRIHARVQRERAQPPHTPGSDGAGPPSRQQPRVRGAACALAAGRQEAARVPADTCPCPALHRWAGAAAHGLLPFSTPPG